MADMPNSILAPNIDHVEVWQLRSNNGCYCLTFDGGRGRFAIQHVTNNVICEYGLTVLADDSRSPRLLHGTYFMALQHDHNLVVYDKEGHCAVWATGTLGRYGSKAELFLCDSGSCHLVENGRELWTSRLYTWSSQGFQQPTDYGANYLKTHDDGQDIIFERSDSSRRRAFMSLKVLHTASLSVSVVWYVPLLNVMLQSMSESCLGPSLAPCIIHKHIVFFWQALTCMTKSTHHCWI